MHKINAAELSLNSTGFSLSVSCFFFPLTFAAELPIRVTGVTSKFERRDLEVPVNTVSVVIVTEGCF